MVGKCPILGTVQSPGDGEFSCLPTKQFDSQAIVQESTSTARRRRPSTASTARTLFRATFAYLRSISLTHRRPVPSRPAYSVWVNIVGRPCREKVGPYAS